MQKWAKKLATRAIASAMMGLGSIQQLPTALSSPMSINLEVRDAARRANFQQYEPISPVFTKQVQFASGVHRALEVFRTKGRVESLWIFKQLPTNGEFNAEHAGMIYGLGLTGALGQFTSVDAYELLSAGHEDLSSALILGLAISNAGTGHQTKFLASMIGVHLPGYLPDIDGQRPQMAQIPRSNQVAAGLALGHLFKGTGDRRVSNVLFKEISRRGLVSAKSRLSYSPAYSTTCGMAFGLVNEGHSDDLPEEQIEHLIDCINGGDDHNVPAAFFALLGVYSGTDDRHVASRILVGHEAEDQSKPLFLFLKYLLRALISGAFPADIMAILRSLKHCLERVPGKWDLDTNVAAWTHTLAAYAMYLAIFCAGTGEGKATEQLRAMYNLIEKRSIEIGPHMHFAERYRQKNVAFFKDILVLALSIVNSGTGDKETFVILRSSFMNLLDECPSRAYIHHLALGFLLLGEGRFGLGTDQGRNPLAATSIMASVLAAFEFPFMEDNYFTTQHMAWLWTFAANNRKAMESLPADHGHEAPEDLFLSERPCRLKFYQRLSGNGKLYAKLPNSGAEFLKTLYGSLSERREFDLTADIMALSV